MAPLRTLLRWPRARARLSSAPLPLSVTRPHPLFPPSLCHTASPPLPSLVVLLLAAGFKQLVKDARLELKVYDIDQMARLFNLKGGAKGLGLESEDGTSLGIEQFLTLLVNLAFYRDNPRYVPHMAGAPKMTQETVPLLQCVQNMMTEFLPKMKTGITEEFRQVLKGDADAKGVLEAYTEKVTAWVTKLTEKAEKTNSDVFTQFIAALEETGSLGIRTLDATEASGILVTHKSSLTELQARHAFMDSQAATELAVTKPNYDISYMLEALGRCGDKKYASIMEMSFSKRIEGMLKNVLNEATELEVLDEATVSVGDDMEGASAYDEKVKAALQANWLVCWKNMTFKDLYGYPLWETQLHDVLQAAFPELQSIFLSYCGSSIAGHIHSLKPCPHLPWHLCTPVPLRPCALLLTVACGLHCVWCRHR